MNITGEQSFEASPDAIWDQVFQAEVLHECIPGAQRVEEVEPGVFEGEVERGLASFTVGMKIRVAVAEDNRPDSVVCDIEGNDNRTNSTVDGTATASIEEMGDESVLSYEAELNFTGRLASLGARLIKRQMNKDLGTFFSELQTRVQEAEAQAS